MGEEYGTSENYVKCIGLGPTRGKVGIGLGHGQMGGWDSGKISGYWEESGEEV